MIEVKRIGGKNCIILRMGFIKKIKFFQNEGKYKTSEPAIVCFNKLYLS